MDIQALYRAYRPDAVLLAEKQEVPLVDALHALVRAATQCPSMTTPLERNYYMRSRIEDEIVWAKRERVGLRASA